MFLSLVLFHFVWKALGQRGSVDLGFGTVASLVFGAGGLGQVAGGLQPPFASPAPTSLACPHRTRLPPPAPPAPIGLICPHGEEEGSALVLGIGLRLWVSALGFPSLSLSYISP